MGRESLHAGSGIVARVGGDVPFFLLALSRWSPRLMTLATRNGHLAG